MLHMFTNTYEFENVVNTRIRSFLHSHGYPEAIVSRDLITDSAPDVLVWSRIIGPAVFVTDGLQYENFQVTVTCKGTLEKGSRQFASELTALLRAYLNSSEILGLPITYVSAESGAYPTNSLDGLNRPAYTFSVSVYQITNKTTV